MLLSSYRGSPAGARRPAHVIVVGNEKGGSGKSTTAMHVAVALLKLGCSVATVDLDGRQLSLTRYVENRARWSRSSGVPLPVPAHFHVPPARRESITETEGEEFRKLTDGLAEVENVDAVASAIDIALHLRVPAPGLVSKMHTGFQQLFHAELCHVFLQVDPPGRLEMRLKLRNLSAPGWRDRTRA